MQQAQHVTEHESATQIPSAFGCRCLHRHWPIRQFLHPSRHRLQAHALQEFEIPWVFTQNFMNQCLVHVSNSHGLIPFHSCQIFSAKVLPIPATFNQSLTSALAMLRPVWKYPTTAVAFSQPIL